MDDVASPSAKLECLIESSKIIAEVLSKFSNRTEPPGVKINDKF